MISLFRRNRGDSGPWHEQSKKAESRRMLFAGQSFWYMLTIVIYLGCTLLGFAVAYFIVRILVDMKVN